MSVLRFENPANGHVEEFPLAWLWMFLCGPFYFGYKGMWGWAVASVLLGIASAGISWLILPVFADSIIPKSFLQKGWKQLPDPEEEEGPVTIVKPKRSARQEEEHQRKLAEAKKKMGW